MAQKQYTAEASISQLRTVEIETAKGIGIVDACRKLGITEQTYRYDLLDGELFYTLLEAQVWIERWRRHDNTKRPHSSRGYRPPAPDTITSQPVCA